VNKAELDIWLEEAESHHWTEEYDGNGNLHESVIYSYKGEDFVLYFCNGHPCEFYLEGEGIVRCEYEPMKVILKERTIVVEEWFTEDGHNIDYFMG
jgi:hypothetical protein